ncbi:HupE/UreJ family protein [Vibrio europaeus]|uniref:HupE/UreJ family protein n=1 Tax=Vibrio europaeus TaxID=300876 RepID=UPI00233E8288|nr:HupE/UreJ family protein [Vibrio europaeus]MDC5805351.1 HupE/UreJ family protein [Vibrio europaeus]MDC5826574.1 HupE/UreJ family protein [Vibrio europaeus]MDC5831940.1 HupE/UreJ family protein [Vibrio europaeus]MDC5834895.1 HupE/UreJ family protein [Vibrio europaeus]
MKKTQQFAAFTCLALLSSSVMAHPVHETGSFSAGLTHPVTGFDHLVMLVAFGILVACVQTSVARKAGLVFSALASLLVGLAAGQVFGGFNGVELAIGASLFVVSGAIWQAFHASKDMLRFALTLCVGLVFFHGYAHGVEAQGAISSFAVGMTVSAAALMVLGLQFGRALSSPWLSVGVASVSALVIL